MKYRIKNPEVEKAVRGLFKTQEDFEAQLNLECEKQKHSVYRIFRIAIEPNLCVLNSDNVVGILKSDVEEVVEYDPKVWNEYPKVTPPKDDYYRVQMTLPNFEVKRFMLEWRDGKWRVDYLSEHRELLFKPWDDEETVESKVIWDTVGTIRVDEARGEMIDSFIKKVC